jgi:hypothetical protein
VVRRLGDQKDACRNLHDSLPAANQEGVWGIGQNKDLGLMSATSSDLGQTVASVPGQWAGERGFDDLGTTPRPKAILHLVTTSSSWSAKGMYRS